MPFNELNSVEHFIIHQLSGLNLNTMELSEDKSAYGVNWEYRSPEELNRSVNEVLVTDELKAALIRLNPEITAENGLAEEGIHQLRAILLSVNQ
ncbi:MAG: hypothetical protein WBA74_15160, partial [Cyclobacteriaceae bacterium]